MKRFHLATCVLACVLLGPLSGCTPPVDAIVLSNDQLLIDRNTQPVNIQIWNGNAGLPLMTADVRPSKPWIQVSANVVSSVAPAGAALDKKTIKITIDRRTLAKGTYNEEIVFRGRGLVSKSLAIRVIQDQDGTQAGDLNIIDLGQTYEKPYLISFNFRLEDRDGSAVVGEPGQFEVDGLEGATPVSDVTGLYLRRAAARQFKAAVVFDYSLSMQNIPGAVGGMEDAAKGDFLPALNDDALVSLYEFHVETEAPNQVTGFTADKDFLINRINNIEDEFVGGFTGGSLAWDALVLASEAFGTGTSTTEDRYLIIFTDGKDTSSANDVNDVIAAARSRGIRVFTVAFGPTPNEADLEAIATETFGGYVPASSAQELQAEFEKIIEDLEGQYVLRWASLARADVSFVPSFTISFNGASDTLAASREFSVRQNAGNALEGRLRIVPSDDEVNSIAFLRADYVPRDIRRLRLFVQGSAPFTVSAVPVTSDGLVANWSKTETVSGAGRWIDLTAPGGATIPFATFGPLLRFDFEGVVDDLQKPFEFVFVDTAIYANAQTFDVVGYDNVLPAP